MSKSIQYPFIHNNGTSPVSLIEDNLEVLNLLREAMEALQKAGPNPRDYYPLGNEAFKKAKDQHVARFTKISEVYSELEILTEYINDQNIGTY